jgi:phage-related protein
MIFLSVLLAGLLQAQASETKDLEYAFRIDDIHRGDALLAAVQHEKSLNDESSMYISCTNYHNNRRLKSTLDELMGESFFHPVYFSEQSNRVCYTFNSNSVSPKLNQKGIRTTAVPHALKIGSEFHLTFDQLVSSSLRDHNRDHGTFVMELGLGVGVLGKGLKATLNTHKKVFADLMDAVRNLHSNSEFLSHHIDSFFWTSPKNSQLLSLSANPMISEVRTNRKKLYLQSFSRTCDFSSAKMEVLESHITLTMKLSSSELRLKQGLGGLHPLCALQLTSLASLHSDITHIIFHSAEKILTTQSSETESQLTSGPYDTSLPATDQNQYVQSGDEFTPYSDLGIDGSGFVLGMIDSGIDDLSCFLVDYSLTPTTRTPGSDYANPITEPYRRK